MYRAHTVYQVLFMLLGARWWIRHGFHSDCREPHIPPGLLECVCKWVWLQASNHILFWWEEGSEGDLISSRGPLNSWVHLTLLTKMDLMCFLRRHHVGWFPFRQRPVQNFPNDGGPQEAVNQDPNNNFQVWSPENPVWSARPRSPSSLNALWFFPFY